MQEQDILKIRLLNQQLNDSKFTDITKLVKYLGAVQSQDYEPGKLTIGLRVPNSTSQQVEELINQRKIVRTWPMRGTLHYVSSEDVYWMTKLLGPRINRKMASYYKKLDMSEEVINRAEKILIKNLKGNNQIDRQSIYELWEKEGINTKQQRGLFLLQNFAQKSLICFGSRKDKQFTFGLIEDIAPNAKKLSQDESLKEIALRYFTSHGPAQISDLAWWSGLTIAEVKKGIELNGKDLLEQQIEDRIFYMSPNIPEIKEDKLPIKFLQAYDEFTIAYKDRSDMSKYNIFVKDGFYAMIIKNGEVIGSWRRALEKDLVILQAKMAVKLNSQDKKDLENAAKLYEKFYDVSTELKLV